MTYATQIEVEDCAGKINLKSGFSVAFWLRQFTSNSNTKTKRIFHAQPLNSSSSTWFSVFLNNNDDLLTYVGTSGDGTAPTPSSFKPWNNYPSNNTWTHIVVTWDTTRIGVYRDGGNYTSNSFSASLVGNERITIGKGNSPVNVVNTNSQGWNGLMNQFSIYNRVITANEVKGLFFPGLTTFFPPLSGIVLMLYEDNNNVQLTDISPNAFPLTFAGTVPNIMNVRPFTLCNAPLFCGSPTPAACLRADFFSCALLNQTNQTYCPQQRGMCVDTGGGSTKCQCAPGFGGSQCATSFSLNSCDPTKTVSDSYASFSGNSGDYIQVDDCTLDLASTDFSLSFWAQPATMSTINPVFSTGDRNQGAFYLYFYSGGIQFGYGTGSDAVIYYYRCLTPTNISVVSKVWHLVTARFQRSIKTLDISLDGQLVSYVTSGNPTSRVSAPIYVGRVMNGGSTWTYSGSLDEFRIHMRAITLAEIASLVLGAPPANTNLVMYFPFNDVVREASARVGGSYLSIVGAGVTISSLSPVCRPITTCNPDPCGGNGTCGANGAAAVCSCYNAQGYFSTGNASTCTGFRDPKIGCIDGVTATPAANFQGPADCVELRPCHVQLASSADFSVEVWFRRTTTTQAVIFSRGTYPSNLFLGFNGNSTLQFGWGGTVVSYNCQLTQTGWHHVAGTFTSSGTTLNLYLDGVLVSTQSGSALAYNGTDSFYLGCAGLPSVLYPFVGFLSQFHVYSRVLSAADVTAHFNNIFNSANSANMIVDMLLDGDVLNRATTARTQALNAISLPALNVSTYPLCLDTSQNPCSQGRPCGANGDCRPGATATTYVCLCRPGYFGATCNSPVCPVTSTASQYLELDGADRKSVV